MFKPNSAKILPCFYVFILSSACLLAGQARPAEAPERPVYVVPFSHLDLFWAGTREEDLARGNKIISKAIAIAEQHPEFRFFIESDNFLANFAESRAGTKELEELKRLVKEGRIGIAPNWADIFINLPDGEVQARNLLYGKLYAREVFGVNPQAIQPDDIPGFVSQYPQMLREADIANMVMSRMGPPEQSLFHWMSPDGSRVLVWNDWMHGYGWGVHLGLQGELTPEKIQTARKELEEVEATTPAAIYLPWGMDLWAPPEKLVANVGELNRDLPSRRFQFGTPDEFFGAASKAQGIAEISGGIPMGWPHVVDSIIQLWQLAVPATRTLRTAEEFSALNHALGYAAYPQADLDLLWKKLIESMDHNHDGQGGAIGDRRKQEDSLLVMMRGGEILRDMLRNIAERVQIPVSGSVPIVVFNGQGWPRDGLVKTHLTLYGNIMPYDIGDFRKGMNLVDAAGKAVPFSIEQTSRNISEALDLVFEATDVPSLGYKTYYLTPAPAPQAFPAACEVSLDSEKDAKEPRRPLGSDVMESRFYRVTVDKATGGVTVFDKGLNRDVVKDARIVGVEERGSNNVQPETDTGVTFPVSVSGTALEENNAVRAVLKVSESLAGIPIVQRLILYADLRRLDIENSLQWKTSRLMRVEQLFRLAQPDAEMEYGTPFGADSVKNLMPGAGPRAGDEINRDAWEQYREMHGWVFAGSPDAGVTIAADHQLVRLQPGLICANMIRGQRYTSVKIMRDGIASSVHYPAKGNYLFKYSLTSGTGDWKAQRSYQFGRDFINPLIPVEVVDNVSSKSLPPANSFCSVKGDDLVISALKKSQADGSIILRLYEVQGKEAETPVVFLGKQISFRVTNLLEQDAGSADERILRVKPYQIKTLRLRP